MARPKIVLYVDIVSPFAYMAWWMLKNNPAFKSVEIQTIPIFLGGLMQACANTAPINIKNKDRWIGTERLRWAHKFNIPISESGPSPFPQSTLNPMRAIWNVQHDQEKLDRCLDALWKAFWVEGKTIKDVGVWGEALEDALGAEEGAELVRLAGGKEAKEGLKGNTEAAFEAGAFGLPWFVCTNSEGGKEGFWGFDHLGQVMEFLGLDRQDKSFRSLL
ncbi:hypothetical protein LTR78_002597 [Recurvomyces mirabilis]|uniref:Glutathione S-transferase kappa n=1 Tax=Recurvomyces mirabilis TaxID=574656 RepID=A0AAE0WTR1_9PEZI|nr:hypothetical protein LTR78_002597 [Recurvomyces mirabilis]KAK5157526.1 hypothetical protein LTS14_004291 [Recurvomyces mirabilis]